MTSDALRGDELVPTAPPVSARAASPPDLNSPDMVERVIAALCHLISTQERTTFRDVARCAIEAMREPTQAMLAPEALRTYYGDAEAQATWRRMIDEALK